MLRLRLVFIFITIYEPKAEAMTIIAKIINADTKSRLPGIISEIKIIGKAVMPDDINPT